MQRARTSIVLHPHVCIKTYNEAEWSRAEIDWYRTVPWACPPLLWADPQAGTLVTPTLPLAANVPDYQPVDKLLDLLRRLEREGVHHRDVHPANIVIDQDGSPRLIDWETAVFEDTPWSYDLHGPDVSGVDIPEIHLECGPQWVGSDDPFSIKNTWRAQ